jgi:hypothetical protein
VGDTLIGYDCETGTPVVLKYEHRPLGVTVIGRTGYGKTTLLEHLILEDIRSRTSCIVVDAHGDLTNRIVALSPHAVRARIALIEVWEDRPFRLNLFTCPDKTRPGAVDRAADSIVQVFKKLFGNPREYYPRLERDLGHAARTVIVNDGTLLDIPQLFWDVPFRQEYLANVTNRATHTFWQNFDRIGRTDRQMEQLESTISRVASAPGTGPVRTRPAGTRGRSAPRRPDPGRGLKDARGCR